MLWFLLHPTAPFYDFRKNKNKTKNIQNVEKLGSSRAHEQITEIGFNTQNMSARVRVLELCDCDQFRKRVKKKVLYIEACIKCIKSVALECGRDGVRVCSCMCVVRYVLANALLYSINNK